jgi:hypothetical protein
MNPLQAKTLCVVCTSCVLLLLLAFFPPLFSTRANIRDILDRKAEKERVHVQKDFYHNFKCPAGRWIEDYGWTQDQMRVSLSPFLSLSLPSSLPPSLESFAPCNCMSFLTLAFVSSLFFPSPSRRSVRSYFSAIRSPWRLVMGTPAQVFAITSHVILSTKTLNGPSPCAR